MIKTAVILNEATVNGPGPSVALPEVHQSYQAIVVGSGAVAATVDIEVSFNEIDWDVVSTIELSGTGRASGLGSSIIGYWIDNAFPHVRGNVSGISGTGAKVTLFAGFSPK